MATPSLLAALPLPCQAPLDLPLLFFTCDDSFPLHLSNYKSEIKVGEPKADKIMKAPGQEQSRGPAMPHTYLAPLVEVGLVTV